MGRKRKEGEEGQEAGKGWKGGGGEGHGGSVGRERKEGGEVKDCADLKFVQNVLHIRKTLECGPMPNVMVVLPNIGGAQCSTPQSLARAHCSSAMQYR